MIQAIVFPYRVIFIHISFFFLSLSTTCESKGYYRHTNDGLSYPTAAVCPFSAATYDFKTLSSLLADKTDGI
jgi:hypothetical protein